MITYPVDPSKRFVVVTTADSKIVRSNIPWPKANGEPFDIDPDYAILEIVEPDQPVIDPSTHKLVRNPVVDIPNQEYRIEWSSVPLTQEELDEKADFEARKQKLQLVVTAIPTLRNWASSYQSAPDATTQAEALNYVNDMKGKLGTFFDRFADLLEGQHLDT